MTTANPIRLFPETLLASFRAAKRIITQNVDGLHRQAGSRNVIELHGNIQRTKCFDENIVVETWEQTGAIPPRCPRCAGLLRPDVVWFGEMLPESDLRAALEATQNCNVFLCVGTSTVVEPAASLPFMALRHGATVIEINPQDTPLTAHTGYKAGEILPALVAAQTSENR